MISVQTNAEVVKNQTLVGCSPADRRKLLKNGYEVIPVAGKTPKWGWRGRKITDQLLSTVEKAYRDHLGSGIRTGSLAVADIDVIEPDEVLMLRKAIESVLPVTPMDRFGSKGIALCWYNLMPIGKISVWAYTADMDPKKDTPLKLVEFLGAGQQMASYGRHPGTGRPFEWLNAEYGYEPMQMPLADLPQVRIPIQTGRVFRFEAGHHSGMKPATIPINNRPLPED